MKEVVGPETWAAINKAIDYLDPDFGVGPPSVVSALVTLGSLRDGIRRDEPHRHRYALIPVWRADRTAVESWWWCTDHPAGEWVKIEDDAEAAFAIPATEGRSEWTVQGTSRS